MAENKTKPTGVSVASYIDGIEDATRRSSRAGNISVYLMPAAPGQKQLLAKLGKHKMGKGCLYIRNLADVDLGVLETLVSTSVAAIRKQA